MRAIFLAFPLVVVFLVSTPATAVLSERVVADEHGGRILTPVEAIQEILKSVGADKDPTAPVVKDTITPEVLVYLSRHFATMDPSDAQYVMQHVAKQKCAGAREGVLAFLAKHGAAEAAAKAIAFIGRPADAVVLAGAIRPREKWGLNGAEKESLEVLAGADPAVWREVARVGCADVRALAAEHLAASAEVKGDELVALYTAGPEVVRRALIWAFAAKGRPEAFDVLLLAMQGRRFSEADLAWECLKKMPLSGVQRQRASETASRLHGMAERGQHMAAARLAALAGEARGFDWAIDCLREFAESGEPRQMICTNVPDGIPGIAPPVFLDCDRPGFPNFLRLVAKDENREALLDVAYMMSPRNDHGYLVIPVPADSDDGKALRAGLDKIVTDLAREISRRIFIEYPRTLLLTGMTEAEKLAAVKQEVADEDFTIEFLPGGTGFVLKKTTPGSVVCRADLCGLDVRYQPGNRFKHIGIGGGPSEWRKFESGEAIAGVSTQEEMKRRIGSDQLQDIQAIRVTFRVALPDGRDLRVSREIAPDAVLRQDTPKPDAPTP